MGSLVSCKIRRGPFLTYAPASLLVGEQTIQKIQTTDGNLDNGTGTGKGDLVYDSSRTLAASATENLDLLEADAANVNDVQFKPHATTGWITGPLRTAAHTLPLGPGEGFQWWSLGAGKAPVASTGDLVTITNSAGSTSVTYRIIIIGASA